MIGIIGAMDEEVELLIKQMKHKEVFNYTKMNFYQGKINDKHVVVVRCGIGKVNAAICTQVLIDKFDIKYVINTGIAGSLDSNIDIGDIVLSKNSIQYDMDVRAFGYDIGQIPRMDVLSFDSSEYLIQKTRDICKNIGINNFIGTVVTGDTFVSDNSHKERLKKQFSGLCTEMEGASIGHVCYLNNIEFIIIRSISDKADNSSTIDYKQFEQIAISNSINIVNNLIKEI